MKLSVLIPVYNFPVSQLLQDLSHQLKTLTVDGEIICLDDGSERFVEENLKTARATEAQYLLQTNHGRAFTRNKLSGLSKGEWLLFLDCDSEISAGFLQEYLHNAKSGSVLYGGTTYPAIRPVKLFALHWKYGKSREALSPGERSETPFQSFKSNNYFLERELYISNPMDQSIVEYGYEDLLWALQLKEKSVPIRHIDNPVMHLGLDSADRFLEKTAFAIGNLHFLLGSKKLQGIETRLLHWYSRMKKWKMTGLFQLILVPFLPWIIRNLKSNRPSMFLLDIYKLHLMIAQAGSKKFKTL